MYNLIGFNLGAYNVGGQSATNLTGKGTFTMSAGGSCKVKYNASAPFVRFRMAAEGGDVHLRRLATATALLLMNAAGQGTRRRWQAGEPAKLRMNASGGYIGLYGSDYLKFDNITIPAGVELTIDTDEMTAMLGGENAIMYLSDDSTFFELKPGNNEITVEGGVSADVYLIWKDRWL